jgi:hypothetical protein
MSMRDFQAEQQAWDDSWKEIMYDTSYTFNVDEVPGLRQISEDCEKRDRGEQIMMVNNAPMGMGMWNLIITRHDFTLWVKLKIKPHRHWKVTQAKKYWGLKGSGLKMMAQFMALTYSLDPLQAQKEGIEVERLQVMFYRN